MSEHLDVVKVLGSSKIVKEALPGPLVLKLLSHEEDVLGASVKVDQYALERVDFGTYNSRAVRVLDDGSVVRMVHGHHNIAFACE